MLIGSRAAAWSREGKREEGEQRKVSGNGLEKQVTRFAGGFDMEDR